MGQPNPMQTPATQSRRDVPADDPTAESAAGTSTRLGSYLRRLREGYGYTLRKVEERANDLGEAIDNSQLSRFEKGKAVPSFEKLRALARVFNVPVQNFSDLLDLEEFQHLKPKSSDYAELFRAGNAWIARCEYGRAFVTYERALEVAHLEADSQLACERIAEARGHAALALKKLGKLYLAEKELREILKHRSDLEPRTRLRTLLQLSYLYRELNDLYLASVLARECLELARREGNAVVELAVLNTLGNIEYDDGQAPAAADYYQQALTLLDGVGGHLDMQVTVLTNFGGCLVTLGRVDEGMGMLRKAQKWARHGKFRRPAALALTRLAEAHQQLEQYDQAREALYDSDALAQSADERYYDILFLNSYHRWTMARREGNDTREKIAFGRLRHLRSRVQRRFAEVEAFDRHVERTRR